MNRITIMKNWLVEPTVKGTPAIFCAIAAVAAPTAVRASVDGIVTGCYAIPYVPFIVLAAIFLGWRYAIAVTLVSSMVVDALFMGPNHHHELFLETVCDVLGMSSLLISAGLIVGFVEAARRFLREFTSEHTADVVFSLKDGEAWASWYGNRSPVHLGSHEKVAEMMDDFLKQKALAERWQSRPPKSTQYQGLSPSLWP